MRIQQESSVTWDREVIHRQSIQRFGSLKLAWSDTGRSDFGKAVRDIKNEDDEETVRRALDLEVSEEGVGTEEV